MGRSNCNAPAVEVPVRQTCQTSINWTVKQDGTWRAGNIEIRQGESTWMGTWERQHWYIWMKIKGRWRQVCAKSRPYAYSRPGEAARIVRRAHFVLWENRNVK